MSLIYELEELYRDVSRFDVHSFFPETYSDDVCYVEFSQQLMLRELLNMITRQEKFLLRLLEIFKVDGYARMEDDSEREEKIKIFTDKIYKFDPFALKEGVLPKEFIEIKERLKGEPQPVYVNAIRTLNELSWKQEMLGGNAMILKRELKEACGGMSFNVAQKVLSGPGIGTHTQKMNRGGAVMFGKRSTEGLDVTTYGEEGSKMLHAAVVSYHAIYKIAEIRGDYIQAFRGFRKAVRVKKRFGLSKVLVNHFIEKDKEMLKLSLEQMGSRIDDMQLRKYEVENRAEQHHRNLKYKSIIIGK